MNKKQNNFKYLLKSLRPRQWTKNLIVFAAPFFSFQFNNLNYWIFALSCFLLFTLSSSAIYLLNDCLDVEYDRKHPIKRNRPIAAGLVSRNFALSISILLIIFCVSSAFFIKNLLAGLICLYILIQISYCIKLKKEPLLDIFCLAAGFLIRATSGAVATGLFISPWFLLSTGLLALFLAIEKRKAELKHSIDIGKIEREVLKRYSLPLLNFG